jgi:hypothetical protein
MDAAEAFRKNAEACSQMADKSPDPWDRANWMRLAESWTRLAKSSVKSSVKTGTKSNVKIGTKSSTKPSDASRPAATAPAPEAGTRRKRGKKPSDGRRRTSRKA